MGSKTKGLPSRTCACGKQAYRSRRDARTAARRLHPGDTRLSAYACQLEDGAWHLGHLKGALVGGKIRRSYLDGTHTPAHLAPDAR